MCHHFNSFVLPRLTYTLKSSKKKIKLVSIFWPSMKHPKAYILKLFCCSLDPVRSKRSFDLFVAVFFISPLDPYPLGPHGPKAPSAFCN